MKTRREGTPSRRPLRRICAVGMWLSGFVGMALLDGPVEEPTSLWEFITAILLLALMWFLYWWGEKKGETGGKGRRWFWFEWKGGEEDEESRNRKNS